GRVQRLRRKLGTEFRRQGGGDRRVARGECGGDERAGALLRGQRRFSGEAPEIELLVLRIVGQRVLERVERHDRISFGRDMKRPAPDRSRAGRVWSGWPDQAACLNSSAGSRVS